MFSVPSLPGENQGERLGEFETRSRGFSPAREFSQTLSRFLLGYEGTGYIFYFFEKSILFSNLTKRKTIYKARLYSFISFMKL